MSSIHLKLFFVTSALTAAAGLYAVSSAVTFETRPRIVAEGRDPMISVRASGVISLSKVLKGDLWLQTSLDGGDHFERGVRVNDVAGEVSSHPESSPQMQVRTRSEFYCLWQTRRGEDEGSVLRFARSTNWGESFSKAIDVDTSSASQSFFTMNVSPKGIVYAAWLDGRDRGKGRQGTSAVYLARSVNRGVSFEKPVRVAMDVCPCCRPNIAFGEQGVFVSWRGVFNGNVRDIVVAASNDDGATWAAPVRVAEDNWVLNGCPHSGATMASIGKRLYIAWHTVREKQPALSLAYSDDGGKTFSRRTPLSEGVLDPNHPYMQTIGDRLAVVFQGRPVAKGAGWAPLRVYYREVEADGRLSSLQSIASLGSSASYPVFAFEEPERFFVTWTETKQDDRVIVMARGRRTSAASGVGRAAK